MELMGLLEQFLKKAAPKEGLLASEELVVSCDIGDDYANIAYKFDRTRYELNLKRFEIGVVDE